MVNRDLLKEAIADAKAVKETAIANAKAALEEAFTPMTQEKFAKKIAQLDEEDENEEMESMNEDSFTSSEKSPGGYGKIKNVDDYSDDYPKKSIAKYGDDETKKMGGGEIDEIDLEELLRELDEMEGEEKLINNPGGAGNLPKPPNMVEEEEEEEMKYDDEDADGIEDSDDDEIDIANMDESDLKSFIESVIADMVAAGELEGGEGEDEESEEVEINERKKYGGNKGDVPASKRGDKKDTAEEEGVEDYKKKKNKMKENYEMEEAFDPSTMSLSPEEFMQAVKYAGMTISGLVGGGAAMANKDEIAAALKGAFEKVKGELSGNKAMAETEEMEEMKGELEEAYKTIKTIQTELQEVNLFNAKLLYTNKIFKAKTLTESQKVKVLAAFDKAASVKEAKLVFETLSEGMKETKKTVNESMLRGSASRAAGVAEKKPILEVNDQFARWQTLAGIKK